MIHWSQFITFLFSLFAITNPFGNLAIFLGLTADKTPAQIRKTVSLMTFTIAIVLLISTWAGYYVLKLFAISISSYEVAGGLIIALIGLSMLQAKPPSTSHTKNETRVAKARASIAVVPMSIPIIAGPGAMTAVIVASHKYPTMMDRFYLSIGCIIITLLIGLIFSFSSNLAKLLGEEGIKLLSRVMGMVLTAMAFQMILNGLKIAFPGLVV